MIALFLTLVCAQEGGWTPPPPPPVLPTPRSAQPRFAPFVLPDAARIVAVEDGLGRQAALLQDTLEKRLGRRLPLGEPPAKGGDLTLTLGYLSEEVAGMPEAFGIEVFEDHVVLSAESPVGMARSVARLAQLFTYDGDGDAWTLPPTRIDDAPAFGWRGLMLDLARFPHSVESVREAIDLAFLYSLNVVHLHLSDDQAFTFPASCLPPRTDPGKGGRDRGYSKGDLTFLVQYAMDRGVVLVPEIDMPAHSSALIRARPDLFGTVDAKTGEARATRAVNMASGTSVAAMKDLVDEVIEVFSTSPYFHLGGDEVYAPGLLELPEFLALAEAEGLPKTQGEGAINALLNHFLQGMADHVEAAGLQPIVWEGFRPVAGGKTLSPDVWVMAWNQHSQTPEALGAAGHTLINCGWEPLYIVPAQGWASQPGDAYDWSPRSVRQRFGGRVAQVGDEAGFEGSQICVWEQRPEAIVPGVLGVLPEIAERMWGSHGAPGSHGEFVPLAERSLGTVRSMLRPVEITWASDVEGLGTAFRGKATVAMAAGRHAAPGVVRYVLSDDFGAEPSGSSTAFDGEPIELTESAVIAAALFTDEGRQIGGVTQVRLEKGEPLLEFSAYRLPLGGTFGAQDFDGLGQQQRIGSGILMGPTPGRIAAINREQFAKVVPGAHVDLRPIMWAEFGPEGERMDTSRPRVTGRHGVVAQGQLVIDEPGLYRIELKSRGGVGRLRMGAAGVSCGADNRPVTRSARLGAGTYALSIEHAMLDVHNDLQVQIWKEEGDAGPEERRALTDLLAPMDAWIEAAELLSLESFGD